MKCPGLPADAAAPGGARSPRRVRFVCAAGAWLLCCAASAADLSEYEVKAAFIYNFAKFTEWPSAPADRPLKFCVLGSDPFGAALDPLSGRTAQGRPISVERGIDLAEADACALLFVHDGAPKARDSALGKLAGLQVLTVGDQPGFALAGGMIELLMVDNRVQFEVNLTAVKSAKLKISAQLLKLARHLAGAP